MNELPFTPRQFMWFWLAARTTMFAAAAAVRKAQRLPFFRPKRVATLCLVLQHQCPTVRATRAFRCSESTARIISPLVEIVGGPVAGFVYTIRYRPLAPEEWKRVFPAR